MSRIAQIVRIKLYFRFLEFRKDNFVLNLGSTPLPLKKQTKKKKQHKIILFL